MNSCELCEHYLEWDEYGWPRGDCTNKKAFAFIGELGGVEDPGKSGCPHFDPVDNA